VCAFTKKLCAPAQNLSLLGDNYDAPKSGGIFFQPRGGKQKGGPLYYTRFLKKPAAFPKTGGALSPPLRRKGPRFSSGSGDPPPSFIIKRILAPRGPFFYAVSGWPLTAVSLPRSLGWRPRGKPVTSSFPVEIFKTPFKGFQPPSDWPPRLSFPRGCCVWCSVWEAPRGATRRARVFVRV